MTKIELETRIAQGFIRGSIHGSLRGRISQEEANDLARELLESVDYKSLAAARREIRNNPRWRRVPWSL